MGIEHASILVVDDELDSRELLADAFARAGHVVHTADSGAAALAALNDNEPTPELILIDLCMPEMDGLTLLTEIRDGARTADVPVIVVSGYQDVARRVESLDAGANDYVSKPVHSGELLARARSVLRTSRELERLRRGSFLDPLTGLLNRHGLDHLLGLQIELAIRHHATLAVLFLDLDGFKRVNDDCGHVVGDRILCDVARALEAQLRHSDFAARWGGDEFVVVLPGADPSLVAGVVDRLETAIASLPMPPGMEVTASIGGASLFEDVQPSDDTARLLVERADEAMYRVKQRHHAALGTPVLAPAPEHGAPVTPVASSRAARR